MTDTTIPNPSIPPGGPAPAPAAPAPAYTPPPAPVAPPAPPAPEPKGKGKEAVPSHEYQPTGDAKLDMALGFVGKLGYGPDDPAIQAAIRGDFSLIRAHLSTREDARGYEAYLALGEEAFKARTAKAAETQAQVESAVFDAVGGQEQFTQIRDWARANADPHEIEQINGMFDAGPVAARAAAIYLQHCYNNAQGTVQEPASAVRPGATRATAPASGALSPEGYKAAMTELVKRIGASRVDSSPEYAQLRARRAAWRG